jgi:hypothetical protein
MCLTEQVGDQALATYAGMQTCEQCRGGDPRVPAEKWGLELVSKTQERRTAGQDGAHQFIASSRVRRPTRVEIQADLRLEGLSDKWHNLWGGGDPETGNRRFDRQVWIEEMGVGVTMEVLADPMVQGAAVEALTTASLWCDVRITFHDVELSCTAGSGGFTPEEVDAMDRAAVALGLAIEPARRRLAARRLRLLKTTKAPGAHAAGTQRPAYRGPGPYAARQPRR